MAVGQEAQKTDFALMPVRLARITGVVMTSDGKPVESAMVNAVPRSRTGDIGADDDGRDRAHDEGGQVHRQQRRAG